MSRACPDEKTRRGPGHSQAVPTEPLGGFPGSQIRCRTPPYAAEERRRRRNPISNKGLWDCWTERGSGPGVDKRVVLAQQPASLRCKIARFRSAHGTSDWGAQRPPLRRRGQGGLPARPAETTAARSRSTGIPGSSATRCQKYIMTVDPCNSLPPRAIRATLLELARGNSRVPVGLIFCSVWSPETFLGAERGKQALTRKTWAEIPTTWQ
jgi:hypothetical protein